MPLTIGAIAAPVIGGIIGQQASQGSIDAANAARQAALAQYAGINVPTIAQQTLSLQNQNSAGTLTPQQEQAIALGQSNLGNISLDPRLASSQMNALQQTQAIANGQPSAADMAGFQLAQQNAAANLTSQNSKVLQDMQQRGQAGSGAELLAKLKNNQDSAQTLATQQLEQAQAMQQARLAALSSQAQMGSNLTNQQYGQQANLANANDAIAKYNAQNSQAVGNTNVSANNNAQAANLQNAQNISNANTAINNQGQIANKGLYQTQFNNQMGLAGAKAGQYGNIAGAAQTQAGNTASQDATIGQGVGQALAGFARASKPTTPGVSSAGDSAFDPSSIA